MHTTPYHPYPVNVLPEPLKQIVFEVHNQVQAPLPMIATSVLSNISVASQGRINVSLPTGSVVPTSLFCLTIADSGERKSTVDRLINKPLLDLQAGQVAEARLLQNQHVIKHKIWQRKYNELISEIDRAISKGEPENELLQQLQDFSEQEPQLPRSYKGIYANATIEALLHGLHAQWPDAALLSSEASYILNSPLTQQLAHLNELWDGDTVHVDRKTRDSFTLQDARLGLSLMVQNEPFQRFLKKNNGFARQSGFLARMLIAQPPSMQGLRNACEDIRSQKTPFLDTYHERIRELLQIAVAEQGQPKQVLEFLPEATKVWREFESWCEQSIGVSQMGEYADVKDAISKLTNNVGRVAALIHHFNGKGGDIDRKAVEAAVQICAWHVGEFKRILGEKCVVQVQLENAELLYQWLLTQYKKSKNISYRKKDIYHYGPGRLRSREILDMALEQLQHNGQILYYPNSKPAYVTLIIDNQFLPPMLPAFPIASNNFI
ncbi:hypothetical protein CUZ56_01196 [Saezia sanguinis]|uniref:DUF3987 domain-containing protein n=1 Tax=Saezia sanguinis TaxID=1965230 RepID=A0A433SEU0_9BURK|nr:YfjI family protein [Saezia sanguinis]RUS67253.1 hypothetical protein CUZ56_01196 [Saezia sanguinis]